MANWKIHARFEGPLVMVGFGSIGKGVLPLILRHIAIDPKKVTIICPDDQDRALAEAFGVNFIQLGLVRENFRAVLDPLLQGQSGFLANLSVDVSSADLVAYAREVGALYIDTCIEPWAGGYVDPKVSPASRSNYALRAQILALRNADNSGPTALLAHGANPGLVSHFVKIALMTIAADTGLAVEEPADRASWASLAMQLGVKGVHVAERDSQTASITKERDEFVNTWSIDGFISEGLQPAELGWGTHEKSLPSKGRQHDFGNQAAIYLDQPGAATRVRSWAPRQGAFLGFLITHNEAISIADYFSVADQGKVHYRPTVHYAYHPCDDAILSLHELAGNAWAQQSRHRLMGDEIASGIDELGVLLFGHARNAYWFGSQLSITEARSLAPHQNATGLQVTAAVLAGMIWAIENPDKGICEPEEINHHRVLEIAKPYLGPLVGAYSDWTPLDGRGILFEEDMDPADPWQFRNILVA